MTFMQYMKQWLGFGPHETCHSEDAQQARLTQADQRLHDQATRLHVLEWEAYPHTTTPRRHQAQTPPRTEDEH